MNKLVTTLLIGLPLLALGSMAQAHGGYHGEIRGSIGVSISLDNGGYLAVGAGYPQPYYYPAPYVRTGYAHGYGNRMYRNGYGHNGWRGCGVKHHRGKGHHHHGKNGHHHRRYN